MDKEDKEKIAEILEESRRLKKEMNYQQINNTIMAAIGFLILYKLSPADVTNLIASIALLVIAICEFVKMLCSIMFN